MSFILWICQDNSYVFRLKHVGLRQGAPVCLAGHEPVVLKQPDAVGRDDGRLKFLVLAGRAGLVRSLRFALAQHLPEAVRGAPAADTILLLVHYLDLRINH